MNKISYSQYSLWANCPMAWKLKYVDGHRFDDSSINTVFGTAMHEVIQEWLEQYYYAGKDTQAKSIDLGEPLKQKFITLFQENTTVDAKQRSATGSGTEGHNTHRNDIWTISRTIFRWTLPRAYANASNATSNESSATGSSPRGRGHTRESETLAPSSYSRTTTNLCRHNGQATACSVNRASWPGALLCRGPAARTRTAAPRQGRFAQITSSWASH